MRAPAMPQQMSTLIYATVTKDITRRLAASARRVAMAVSVVQDLLHVRNVTAGLTGSSKVVNANARRVLNKKKERKDVLRRQMYWLLCCLQSAVYYAWSLGQFYVR